MQWLEANGEAHVEEFAAIKNDEEEDVAVRGEALKWYVRFNTADAFGLLRDYAEDDTRHADFSGGSHDLQYASF